MARACRDAEEVSERGEAHSAHAALEQPARECGRAERRLGEAPAVQPQQLLLEEALVEARVVGDEQVVVREGEEAPENRCDGWSLPELLLAQAGQTRDRLRKCSLRVDERLVRVGELKRPDADRAELADPAPRGREPGRLQVEHDELRLVQ